MDENKHRLALLKAYQIYMEGFKCNNMEMIHSIMKFPIAILTEGKVELKNHFPIDPEALKASKQWHHSSDWKFEITALNSSKAHITASAIRRKEDGTRIEKVSAFYGFSRTDNDWKMYAYSEIII